MRAVLLTAPLVQDQELIVPYYRMQEAGYLTEIATADGKTCAGFQGVKIEPTMKLEDVPGQQWDCVIVPGGVKAMEKLRLERETVQFLADYHAQGGVIGAICSGTQMLISAGLCKGRNISGYYAIRDDIVNAGGIFIDAPAVICDRIVTSPHYKFLGDWMKALLGELEAKS